MASSPYFLVSFITMVIIYPMSVSLLKYEFQEGGVCVLFFSVALPASSFRNRFPNGLQPGPARITQTSDTAPKIPFIIPFIIPLRESTQGIVELLTVPFTRQAHSQSLRNSQERPRGHQQIPWEWQMELLKAPDEILTPLRQWRLHWAIFLGIGD